MLIRVRGGKAGVFDYLRDGKKSGRMFTRDQLDERVVLAGHMEVAESVVNAMSNRGEKYLHITLSFKEDHLPLENLRSITEEFEAFCMRAYLAERAAIRADLTKTPSERKAAYSLASMRKAMESARLYCEIDQERRALREKHLKPGREGYKRFLIVLAEDCDAGALAELRRQTQQAKQPTSGNRLGAEREGNPSKPVLLPSVSYRVDQRGNVTYYADPTRTKPILVDTGRQVEVVDLALDAVETGLRLALQKFGPALDVHGSPEFKAAVLAVVLRTGLRVEFKDPALAAELERLRGTSSQLSQVSKGAPIKSKTEQQIEAEYAGEVYEGGLGRGDLEVPGTELWDSDSHTTVPSPSAEPPRLH